MSAACPAASAASREFHTNATGISAQALYQGRMYAPAKRNARTAVTATITPVDASYTVDDPLRVIQKTTTTTNVATTTSAASPSMRNRTDCVGPRGRGSHWVASCQSDERLCCLLACSRG